MDLDDFREEFQKYVEEGLLQCQKIWHNGRECWVFWAHNHEKKDHATAPNVLHDFMERTSLPESCLVILWRDVEIDGRHMLTSQDQPFLLIGPECSDTFNEKLYSFGMSCFRGHHVFIHEDCELCVISRVFQNQRMEFTRNIFNYSSNYPLPNNAILCKIKSSVAIPFTSLGVIEIVSQLDFSTEFLSNLSIQNDVPENKFIGSISTVESERHATIKANYQDVFIKFKLSASSGIAGLHLQISMRLGLEIGTYTAKYQDEQNDWILIACNEDVRDSISNSSSSDGTLVMLLEPLGK